MSTETCPKCNSTNIGYNTKLGFGIVMIVALYGINIIVKLKIYQITTPLLNLRLIMIQKMSHRFF